MPAGWAAISLASTVLRFSRCCRSPNGRHAAVAHHQQLAVDHPLEVQRRQHVGKGGGDLVAGAAVEPPLAALADRLDADAVPLPFGGVVGRIELGEVGGLVDRLGQHHGPEAARAPRRSAARCGPPARRTGRRRAGSSACQTSSTSLSATPPISAAACLASRAERPTRRPPVSSFSSAQRPSASSASSQPSIRPRNLGPRRRRAGRRPPRTAPARGWRRACAGQTRATVSARSPT